MRRGRRPRASVCSQYVLPSRSVPRESQSGSAGRREGGGGVGTGETASAPGEGEGFPGVPSAFEEGHGCGCNGGGGGVEGELQGVAVDVVPRNREKYQDSGL